MHPVSRLCHWCDPASRCGFLSFYPLDYTAIDYSAVSTYRIKKNERIQEFCIVDYNITGYIHSQKPIVIMNGNRVVAYWYLMFADGIRASSEMRNASVDGDDGRRTCYEATGHLR